MAVAAALAFALAATAVAPELPRERVDVAPVQVTGRTLALGPHDDLQAALRRAERGDEITLTPGAVYRGPFVLPRKDGAGWITIRSAAADALPAGVRVTPADAASFAVLVAPAGHPAVVSTAPGASHYRLVGLEIRPVAGEFLHNVVAIGSGDEDVDGLPSHVVIDRCHVHGDPAVGGRRGIALNGRHLAVVNSHVSDFKEVAADSQAIAGWNGPGPFAIVNNRLEGAGENLMFGGDTARIPGLVPADIAIVGNHLVKPVSWRIDDAQYAGTPWAVKNILELKNARRVLVDGNVLEHVWRHGQDGFAVLLTVRNEAGEMPWAAVHDVTFTNNLVRHVGNGINILGTDSNGRGDERTRRILIGNNLFMDVGGGWGGGRLFQLLDATDAVAIRGNTASQTDSIVVSGDDPHSGFAFTGNAVPHNEYGVVGPGTAPGNSTLAAYFPDAEFTHNEIAGGSARVYPAGNAFPSELESGEAGVDLARLCGALLQSRPTVDGVEALCAAAGRGA